jgi:hypothetical protein
LDVTLENLQKRFTQEELNTVQWRFRHDNNARNYKYMKEVIATLQNFEWVTVLDANPKIDNYEQDASKLYSESISLILWEQVHKIYSN